jgi:hypothetical protein
MAVACQHVAGEAAHAVRVPVLTWAKPAAGLFGRRRRAVPSTPAIGSEDMSSGIVRLRQAEQQLSEGGR